MTKKILHITLATGGVKTYVAHILEYAGKSDFNFTVIAPANDTFEAFCRERNIPYYRVDLHRGNNLIKNFVVLFKIIGIIKKEKPDLLHVHSAKSGFLGRLASKFTGSKVVYTPHAFSYLPFTGISRIIYYMLELSVRNLTTLMLAISYSEANRAIYEVGYQKDKVQVILNSVPVQPLAYNVEAGSGPVKIRVIGRLTHQKNHMLFLEVANLLLKKYPSLQFAILGAGIHDHLTGEIDSYLEAHDLRNDVRIESWGDDLTSETFLKEADIFVMTSVFEGMAFSLLEAMSLGIPCVVTKVDGNTDVINNNENGYACLSAGEFYEKLELLINDPELRRSIGLAGHEYVKKQHNVELNTQKLELVYNKLLQHRPAIRSGAPVVSGVKSHIELQ